MKFCEMNRKLYSLLQWALTYAAHDLICRLTPLFGSYHPKIKSGQWNLNILLIRKQKRIQCFLTSPLLQRTPCRKGPKGFCKMQNKEHDCPWVRVPWGPQAGTEGKQPSQGQSGSETRSWQVATAFLPMSRGIIQKPVTATYQGFRMCFVLYVCVTFSWSSSVSSCCRNGSRLPSQQGTTQGLAFTTGVSGSPSLFQGNTVFQTLT